VLTHVDFFCFPCGDPGGDFGAIAMLPVRNDLFRTEEVRDASFKELRSRAVEMKVGFLIGSVTN
jgi:hypothetical protein